MKKAVDRADRLLSGGAWEEAEELYRRDLAENPNSGRAALGLAIIAFHQGRKKEAAGFLELLGPDYRNHPQARPLRALLRLERSFPPHSGGMGPGEKACRRGLEAARRGEYASALDALLAAARGGNQAAPGIFSLILDVIGPDSEAGREYRKKMNACST